MKDDKRKSHGIHYTPPELADFLAQVTVSHLCKNEGPIEILDPACGGGSLLRAVHDATLPHSRGRLALFGFEQELGAIREAKNALSACGARSVTLENLDFLCLQGIETTVQGGQQRTFFDDEPSEYLERFDAIIANPPYVRTQVLGSKKSQQLARRFGLTGRVDLYHAFVIGMASVLKPGGVLGLLTSNRFLTIKSGASLRHLLRTRFCLEELYDLGDTKLFEAAVLPVILVARKQAPPSRTTCIFDRVYEYRNGGATAKVNCHCDSILDVLPDRNTKGIVETNKGLYTIERGTLLPSRGDEVWSLSTSESEEWLRIIDLHQAHAFDDIGIVRVGIKTTADRVFIRDDWNSLPTNQQPEKALLHPLITHFIANRWGPEEPPGKTRVLYPHVVCNGKRKPIVLSEYPKAKKYLGLHRERLEGRKYVIEAGRQWHEIWVPHNPADWQRPKIVFPDIAELPRFFMDYSGAIVNGDCYWITLRKGVINDWLLMMLAVANSSFITKYYDVVFHNKLYAGRRRFMTQYVKKFPVPHLDSRVGRRIVHLASELVKGASRRDIEPELDLLVWNSFGLEKELQGQVQLDFGVDDIALKPLKETEKAHACR